MIKMKENMTLPILAIRGMVFFPGMMLQFDITRKKSVLAASEAIAKDRLIFLVSQVHMSENEPVGDDLYKFGVIARVKQVLHHTSEGAKLHVEGLCRGEIVSLVHEDPYLVGNIVKCPVLTYKKSYKSEALIRIIHEKFDQYLRLFKHVPPDVLLGVLQEKDCGRLADYIAANISIDFERKQYILDELRPLKRMQKLIAVLTEEIQILEVENEINQKAQAQIDENQREYFLKEQLRAITSELGEEDNPQQEADEIKSKVLALGLSKVCEEKLLKECDKLYRMPYGSHEASVIRLYLDTCLELPWKKSSKEKLDLKRAQRILDRDHYGMTKVKERFIETLAVRSLAPAQTGQIICLVGPPGVGKTSIARSIAQATGRKYARVSLGGVSDEAEIMGHRKTYVGSMPGRIINAIKQAGVNNPLLLLDEIDKLGTNFKGDPASALLEVLDPEQNSEFTDHYIDMPFDLSQVLFITTANDASRIPGPLYDRMDIIELRSYTLDEKLNIAMKHLVRKQLEKHGIKPSQLKFTKTGMRQLIDGYTREAGVRTLERNIAAICRKVAKLIVTDEEFKSYTVRSDKLEELLGPRKYMKDTVSKEDLVGLVNGLAWTSVGGELLPIEVAVMEGTGKIQLTGSLGDVMKESANAAITCIRTRAADLGISPKFYEKYDIHVHAPEGAVPKDGPSAGTAMATAITSALCGIPVRHEVAMTGEITLQGRVLPIGGLREKSMAAYKNGVKTVLIPADNLPDLAEIDQVVKDNVQFVPIKKIDAALEKALQYMPIPLPQEATVIQAEVVKAPPSGYACDSSQQQRSYQ
ncbi:endopeptidase La [Acutalibacter muris]|uniref:Lon protease n=2 Tax=Acutalibacter muris TaxID=1796620 RepID=A0A1Z2XWD5_9FIRM|nr:endopeptidase La [Hungateiclostridiaceae bacterium KB18]ASB42721.1 endopeptidase La [Acutalibacter muris]QQR32158.1 endopeptidase La [Acutalibacter muris]